MLTRFFWLSFSRHPIDVGAILRENRAETSSGTIPMITFACPACSQRYSLFDEHAGKSVNCYRCDTLIRVPDADWVGSRSPKPTKPDTPVPATNELKTESAEIRAEAARRAEALEQRAKDTEWLPADYDTTMAKEERKAMRVQPPTEDGDLSAGMSRYIWGVAGTIAALLILTVVSVLFLNRPARDHTAEDASRANPKQAEAQGQTEKQAEQLRLRGEVERNRVELAELKEEQARKDGNRTTEEALAKVRSVVVDMGKFETDSRAILIKYDQEMMIEFAKAGVDPQSTDSPATKEFHRQRHKLADKAQSQLKKMHDEARRRVDAVRDVPADIKARFDSSAGTELARGEAILKAPLPDPFASYKDAAGAIQTLKDVIRQQKIQKSKQALEALITYGETRPNNSKAQMTKIEYVAVLTTMNRILWLHCDGKLTLKGAQDAMGGVGIGWTQEKFRGVFDTLVSIGGDFRPEHDPNKPSIAETHGELKRLFYSALDK